MNNNDPPIWAKIPMIIGIFLVNVAMLWVPVMFIIALIRGRIDWRNLFWPFG